ncbi:MAG TPA: helix-turn-helix transcriptional regulator [Dinghuibacter sp.]|uniref:AraC family transcriptional regulator n=1 Tax=Dinghuibacter sp. TaxID=2024697 RepID=UPI002C2F88DB|nr:helix-turn-helix transcriptional regulator [Dinghuibacter sp.]HTJ13329.1 helix-turn-helix transcriptional regulator [Dinghuibacter sp.]
MPLPKYSTFGMSDDAITVDRFKRYYAGNPHLQPTHKHSFYHLLYFTQGGGEHTIDFVSFPVRPGMIYFMRPGQMHKWRFDGPVDGYVVNFSPTFFEKQGIDSAIADGFSFFGTEIKDHVLQLSAKTQVEPLFKDMLRETERPDALSRLRIATLLLQLFVAVQRDHFPVTLPESAGYNSTLLHNFRELVDKHFAGLRLPKEYAAMLYITPNHLNALCKDLLGVPAGQVIRDRVMLEAKRLLSNFDLPITEVARTLNFTDSSYFIKFFKKYAGTTPDIFRKRS